MRFILISSFLLLIIVTNLQYTTANTCRCSCCTAAGCTPSFAGEHSEYFCSPDTCGQTKCYEKYYPKCPRANAAGRADGTCIPDAVNSEQRLLPTLFVVIGGSLMVLLLQDKF